MEPPVAASWGPCRGRIGSTAPRLREELKPKLKLTRFRGWLAGSDQSFMAMVLASYSMGVR